MADRPLTLAEKLAAARAAGAAKLKDAEPPAEELLENAPEPDDIPDEAIEEEGEVEEAVTPAEKPKLDRPLTMAEKLAAARSGGAPKPTVAKAAPKPMPAPAAPAPSEEVAELAEESAPAPVSRPAIPTDRPLTLAEKLAAARAASGAPASAKPAAAKPADKPAASAAKTAPAAKAPARDLPPLEKITDPRDLAEAARRAGAVKEKAAAAKEAPTKPAPAKKLVESKAVPAKPAKSTPQPAAATAPVGADSRRGFFGDLGWVVVGWSSFAAGMAAMILGSLRFYFPNVLAEPPSTYKVGLPTTFEKESVDERFKAEAGFWIVRSANFDGVDKIYALSSICTHLGCPPNWLAGEQKFKCPCHGSGFYISGVNFEGPAPRPLERYKIAVGDDGQLVVDKSEKFQEELKQWVNPDSFIVA